MPPQIWLLLADKAGDNAQVEALARALDERLGWRATLKRLIVRPEWRVAKPKVAVRTDHVDLGASDPLEPPWPDLLITIGRRPSSVALWVRQQSGSRTKIILVGKPSSPIEWYDLVVVSAENRLPALANVLPIALPLMRVDREAVAAAVDAWAERLAPLPRPLVGLLVGGPTGPFRYDGRVVRRLLEVAQRTAAAGGTPWLLTSRRTPPPIVAERRDGLPAAGRLTAWQADLPAADNPYRALLGRADGLVVTGDSISMMVEVARLGRPLQLLRLPSSRLGTLDLWRRRLAGRVFGAQADGPLARLLYRLKLVTQTRTFDAFHDYLEERGLASPLGGPFLPPSGAVEDDLERVIGRIAALAQPAAAAARAGVAA
jgi:mitochondrial fission protein ELM1